MIYSNIATQAYQQPPIGSYFLENGEEIVIPEGQAAARCQSCAGRLLGILDLMSSSAFFALSAAEHAALLSIARGLAFEIDSLVALVDDDAMAGTLRRTKS